MKGLRAVAVALFLLLSCGIWSIGADTSRFGASDFLRLDDNPNHSHPPTRSGLRGVETFDVLHYDVNVTVRLDLHLLNGTSKIAVSIKAYTERLIFDLGLMPYDVSLSNGTRMRREYGYPLLTVYSDGLLSEGSVANLVIRYEGIVNEGGNEKTDYVGDEGSWIQQGRFWYPEAHRENSSVPYDRFTADINVTVPNGHVVVSNGALVESQKPPAGDWTYYWRTMEPAKALSFAEGILARTARTHNGVVVEVYLNSTHNHLASEYLDEMIRILDFYASVYSPYPYPKLALVEIPAKFARGGASCQSFVVVQTRVFDDYEPAEGPLAHEVAHNWWGEATSGLGPESGWLQESFASYSSDLYEEHQYGRASRLQQQKDNYFARDYSSYESPVSGGFSVYNKGPWILHMLRYVLGNETFFQAMSEFMAQFAFSTGVRIADFLEVSESVSGRDLDWFFQEWLFGTSHLNLEFVSARCLQQRDGSFVTEVVVHRDENIVMPIDVAFATVDGRTTVLEEYVNTTSTDMSIAFPSAVQTANVTLDPHGWLLTQHVATSNITFVPHQPSLLENPLLWILTVVMAILAIAVVVMLRKKKGAV